MAKRNYRFFYLFLVTITVLSLYVMGCNVAVVVVGKYPQPLGEKDKPFPSLNIAPPSQSAGAWEGGYFVSNARENYLNFCSIFVGHAVQQGWFIEMFSTVVCSLCMFNKGSTMFYTKLTQFDAV